MKKSWFIHQNLTTNEADQLVARYRKNNVKTEKRLETDFIHWTVSAFLPESRHCPRPDGRYQQRFWG